MTVSVGGKVCMFIGFLVLLTGLFVSMSTIVGLFMIFAGIITIIQGNNMKAQEPYRLLPKSNNTHYNTGMTSKRDTTSKGAV